MNEVKLICQKCGSHWAVGVYSEDTELLEQTYNSFWNHGATSSEPHALTDSLWYFWTTPAKLLKAMTNAALFYMLNDADEFKKHDPEGHAHACKGIKGGFMPQARINAQERFDSMESDNFFSPRSQHARASNDYYSLGQISAEKPDAHS